MSAARIPASRLLSADQLADVQSRSDLRGLLAVLHAWGMILAAMALYAWWPNPITFLVSAAIIGGRQLGLSILMHDGAHGLLLRDPMWNMRLSQWLCAWPHFTDTRAYRLYHLKHHARTQQPDDPDIVLSAPFPITRQSLKRKLIRDLTGQTGFQQRLAQIRFALGPVDAPTRERIARLWSEMGGMIVANLVLLALLSAAGYWWLYPLLWLLPLLTVYQLVMRVRAIAEHAMVPDDNDPFRNARTTLANPLERLLFAPYWVNYHVEHHLLMWVPCYNLPKLHHYLMTGPFADRLEVKRGYLEVLRMATSAAPGDGERNSAVHGDRRRVAGLVMRSD